MEQTNHPAQGGGFTAFKPYITFTLTALNILVFAADFLLGFTKYNGLLIYMGAKINPMIAAGEYWRLITPVFLHSGFDHLLSNTIGLLIWGKQVEYILGRARFLTVYAVSGICGALLGFALSNSMSVGASGAIFGLFGVFLYLMRRRRNLWSGPFAMQVLIIIGINLASGFINPRVDNLGHIGGLVGGYLCAWVTGIKGDRVFGAVRVLFCILLPVLMVCLFLMGMMREGAF